jgi:hypothetical protein
MPQPTANATVSRNISANLNAYAAATASQRERKTNNNSSEEGKQNQGNESQSRDPERSPTSPRASTRPATTAAAEDTTEAMASSNSANAMTNEQFKWAIVAACEETTTNTIDTTAPWDARFRDAFYKDLNGKALDQKVYSSMVSLVRKTYTTFANYPEKNKTQTKAEQLLTQFRKSRDEALKNASAPHATAKDPEPGLDGGKGEDKGKEKDTGKGKGKGNALARDTSSMSCAENANPEAQKKSMLATLSARIKANDEAYVEGKPALLMHFKATKFDADGKPAGYTAEWHGVF